MYASKFNLKDWLKDNPLGQTKIKASIFELISNRVMNEYFEVVSEFTNFMQSECESGSTPYDIFDMINEYQIRIKKLVLISNLRGYATRNTNKVTKVNYCVIRTFWIDSNGKPFRNFSKNLGAEHKIKGNEENLTISALHTLQNEMWDLYLHEYKNCHTLTNQLN